MKAAFICFVLSHIFFANADTIKARQAVSDAVAATVSLTANSPETCFRTIDKLVEKVYRESREAGHEVDIKDLKRQKAATAIKCLATFSVNSVSANQLPALTKLYFEANKLSQAKKAVGRYVKSRQVSAADKAEILSVAIKYSIVSTQADGGPALAEEYLARLDQLGNAVVRPRINARFRFIEHYLSNEDDAKALRHESQIAALSKSLAPIEQKAVLEEMIIRLDSLSLAACTNTGATRARVIIEQIPSEIVRMAKAEKWIESILSKYQMEGQDAPQLFPVNVLNPNGSDLGKVQKGQVTVMLLAAHWCVPCHPLYPQVVETYLRFRDKGVQVMLVTQLSNPANNTKAPTPENELALIQKFYIDNKKIPFPILIEGPTDPIDQQTPNRQWSLFSFYPMMLVIDKKGKTRSILIGVSGQAERLRAKIDELLKEPA